MLQQFLLSSVLKNMSSIFQALNFPSGIQYGLIAQDVEQVIPTMVKTFINPAKMDTAGKVIFPEVSFKAVNYETLIPILVAAFQEQKQELDSIKNVLANNVNQPVNSNPDNSPQQRVILSNIQSIILQQNDPNPFSESTIIKFEIPESVKSARILFTDAKGSVLKSATIETRGIGSLEVFASDLSSGIYTYTLVCDGKVIDSKKMMKD